MSLIRYIRRNDAARFALRVHAFAETGSSMELLVTDDAPVGGVRGFIATAGKISIPLMPLPKGALRSIENHALQSGVLQLTESEREGPPMRNGQEFMMLDGIHHTIELYMFGQHRVVHRFNRAEPSFARLFNSTISYAICDPGLRESALRFRCTAQCWDEPGGVVAGEGGAVWQPS